MNEWVIGGFFTTGTPYEQVMKDYLLPSAEELGLRTIIKESKNYGNWQKNVAEKPKIILEILDELPPEQCLVFLDADACIESYPMLFDTISTEYDMACHYLNWNEWYGYRNNPPVRELLSGTLFFRNKPNIKSLCKEWYERAIKESKWEQKVLEELMVERQSDIWLMELPIEYCWIATRPDGRPPIAKGQPVISHHQVSRKYKRTLL